jgi:hypothetical protein
MPTSPSPRSRPISPIMRLLTIDFHRRFQAKSCVFRAARYAAIVGLALAAGASTPRAQTNTAAAGVYRLAPTSTYEHGCFAPCLCPLMETASVRGVFRLVPVTTGNVYQFYEIRDVRWVVEWPTSSTPPLRVVGSGTYKISLGPNNTARTHQMTLDLAIGQNVTQHFDSGLVEATTPFPRIDIDVSINGEYCLDTVFRLHARPLLWVSVDRASVSLASPPDATSFDLVRGDLDALQASGGDFESATIECVADDATASAFTTSLNPPAGRAFYFIARSRDGSTEETWDDGDAEQVRSRDPGLASAASSCP